MTYLDFGDGAIRQRRAVQLPAGSREATAAEYLYLGAGRRAADAGDDPIASVLYLEVAGLLTTSVRLAARPRAVAA